MLLFPKQVPVWVPVFRSFGYNSGSGIARLLSNSMFHFLRKLQTVVHNGCAKVHFSWQRVIVPVSPTWCVMWSGILWFWLVFLQWCCVSPELMNSLNTVSGEMSVQGGCLCSGYVTTRYAHISYWSAWFQSWLLCSGPASCCCRSWEAANDGWGTWVPVTQVENVGLVPGSWLLPGLTLAVASIWEEFSLSDFQIKKNEK